MIKIAVCDDSTSDLKILSDALQEHFPDGLCLRQFSSGESLKTAVESKQFQPDIAFLDILISNCNGINLAQLLNSKCPDCAVVFVSSYLEFALDVYSSKHSYFILKSQLQQRLGAALEKVLNDKMKMNPFSSYKFGSVINKVPFSEILYLERNLKKTIIYLCSGKTLESREKPQNLLNDIDKIGFVQCHQSYFVNLKYVSQMKSDSFILSDGSNVPISRRLMPQAKEAFFKYISSPDLKIFK